MKPSLFFLFLSLSIFYFQQTFAQNKIIGYKAPEAKIKQYKKADWIISVNADFSNPYLQEEVTLDMLLTNPYGQQLTLPCYYESGESGKTSIWRARFLPQAKGKYTYLFRLRNLGAKAFESPMATFTTSASDGKGILHANDDWTFKFDNGEVFRGIGENLAWESRADDDSKFFKALHEKEKYNYEYLLPALKNHGGNYFRTWISSWNLPLDWKSGFNSNRYENSSEYFNPSAIKKMDRLVDLSDSLNLFMMLTLGEGTHDAKHGRYATSTADFFINAAAKAQYKNRLRYIVARWGYSPSIGAWEFFNEIDNVQFRNAAKPIPAADIVSWHEEMSTYLKQIDPYKHLVTTSISHRDLDGLNSLAHIDFNQKHIYKANRAIPTTILKYAKDFHKPYVIGEYGYEYDWSKNFNLFAEEMDSDFKRGLWYGLFSPTPVLPLSWWWEYFDDRGTDKYLSRVSYISEQMLQAGKGSFKIQESGVSSPGIETYALTCGGKTFVYVYNPTSQVVKTDVLLKGMMIRGKKIQRYDCESGVTTPFVPLKRADTSVLSGLELKDHTDTVLIF